jgi:hypothetical protein
MTTARRLAICCVVALAAATTAAVALADGGPINGVEAGNGVTTAQSPYRLVTVTAARGHTLVMRIRKAGGTIDLYGVVRGAYAIPAVAYDGSGGGLTANGASLVLIERPYVFPPRRLRLKTLDTSNMRVDHTIVLKGLWSFDALSPDGSMLYLVKYASATNPTRYAVRAYDVDQARLLPKPIVDRREPDERMRGFPITRATSTAGEWAYTLYDGGGDAPFVHALNTATATAYCIDLDALAGRKDLFDLRLGLSERTHRLTVVDKQTPLLRIDTRTWKVTPASDARRPDRPGAPTHGGGGPSVLLLAFGAAALAAGLGLGAFLRRRRSAAPA